MLRGETEEYFSEVYERIVRVAKNLGDENYLAYLHETLLDSSDDVEEDE